MESATCVAADTVLRPKGATPLRRKASSCKAHGVMSGYWLRPSNLIVPVLSGHSPFMGLPKRSNVRTVTAQPGVARIDSDPAETRNPN